LANPLEVLVLVEAEAEAPPESGPPATTTGAAPVEDEDVGAVRGVFLGDGCGRCRVGCAFAFVIGRGGERPLWLEAFGSTEAAFGFGIVLLVVDVGFVVVLVLVAVDDDDADADAEVPTAIFCRLGGGGSTAVVADRAPFVEAEAAPGFFGGFVREWEEAEDGGFGGLGGCSCS
jgi:hypothetical protein